MRTTLFHITALFLMLGMAAHALPARAADEPTRKEQLHAKAMEADAAYAKIESAIASARKDFLARFDAAGPAQWAADFLKRIDAVGEWQLERLLAQTDYNKRQRETFLNQRASVARYLSLTAKTPVTDPAFAILVRPVAAQASYQNEPTKLMLAALTEYDAHKEKPDAPLKNYVSRTVSGQIWTAIIFPGTEMGSEHGSDRIPAFVMRAAQDGKFTLHPIIGPVRADYYPGEKSPLRPEKATRGPGDIYISECRMLQTLTITNGDGPFSFRVDAEQQFSPDHFSYMCEPKCTGFTYAWSEKGQTFLMRGGECRNDAEWKAKNPFKGETLIQVDEYKKTVLAKHDALQKHEKDVQEAVAGYLALFDGKTLEMVKKDVDAWLLDRQFPLYSLIGQEDAFVSALVRNDMLPLLYMQKVLALAKTPDARLMLLLDEIGRKMTLTERDKQYEGRRYPNATTLLRGKEKTWFAKYAEAQLALLAEPKKDDKNQRYAYTATGLNGGDTIVFTYEQRRYGRESKKFPNTYILRKGSDGAHWGHSSIAVGKRGSYEKFLERPQQRIMRLDKGKISFVTPDLPKEKEFFTKAEADRYGRVQWETKDGKSSRYYCDMQPEFVVNTAKAPFTVTAKDVQIDQRYHMCVPECSIPYKWNGKEYVKGAPECLPAGKWGVSEIDRGKR